LLDIKRIKITGDNEHWVAIPDGYKSTLGYHSRTATGGRETLAMLRDIANEMKQLPSDGTTYLVLDYSTALLNDPKHGRDIKRQIEDIERKGGKVGVYAYTSQAFEPVR
jgi:hypothetical protein